jgi:hypothetical protein
MTKELQETLEQADAQFNKIRDWMQSKEISGDIEVRVIASYILIATNHFDSIIELIKKNKRISAATLGRPHYEAFLRATWLSTNEHTKEVKKAIRQLSKNKGTFPTLWKMAKDIENVLDINFHDSNLMEAFHNYTHGGSHMLARCMSEDTIAPHFTDEEMIGLLKGVAMNTFLTVLAYASKVGDEDLAIECNKEVKSISDIK